MPESKAAGWRMPPSHSPRWRCHWPEKVKHNGIIRCYVWMRQISYTVQRWSKRFVPGCAKSPEAGSRNLGQKSIATSLARYTMVWDCCRVECWLFTVPKSQQDTKTRTTGTDGGRSLSALLLYVLLSKRFGQKLPWRKRGEERPCEQWQGREKAWKRTLRL